MKTLPEALEAAGESDSEDALFEFFAVFLRTTFSVPATPVPDAAPAPLLVPVDGVHGAVAYASPGACREELPTGSALTDMRGDDLVMAIPPERGLRILLILDDGSALPLAPDMVKILRVLVEKTAGGEGRADAGR